MVEWLVTAAEHAKNNFELAASFLEELRQRLIIVPAASTVERLCADALVEAERRITNRITERLTFKTRGLLESLLEEKVNGRTSKFIWLRQACPGSNSAVMNKILARLELIKAINLESGIIADIPPHRISRLRKKGERLYTGISAYVVWPTLALDILFGNSCVLPIGMYAKKHTIKPLPYLLILNMLCPFLLYGEMAARPHLTDNIFRLEVKEKP